nr:MAG TPA: intron-associated endonuclease 1 [Caudoviricetes sp.]
MLKKQLDASEIKYIALYDTFKNGYNSTLGGGGTIGKDP